MLKLKNFKCFLNEKFNLKEVRENIIKKITGTIEKYKLPYLLIGNEITIDEVDYYINSFNRSEDDGSYFLDYDIDSKNKEAEFNDLSTSLLIKIWEEIEDGDLLNPANLLETLQGEYLETFKIILIKTKKPIKFNSWIFGLFYENGTEDNLMDLKFQDILFKTHPEAAMSFLESGTRILPSIISKYNLKDVVDKYDMEKNIEKFNI